MYRGTAPIFVTTTLDDMKALRAASVSEANASMLLRRLKVYEFTVRSGVRGMSKVQFCARCFSRFVKTHGE